MSVLGNIDRLVADNIRILTLPPTKLPRPVGIYLLGIPGSGKSTFARNLAKSLPIAVISDEAMSHFLLPYKATFLKHSQKEFLLLASKTMERLVQQGYSCVYDSSIKSRSDREIVHSLIKNAGGVPFLVYLKIDTDLAFRRVEKENLAISRGEVKGFILSKEFFEYESASTEFPLVDEEKLVYDSTNEESIFTLVEQIKERIKT